jgi:tripartite-type tricarboxylate transporter receptor subunit TctC
VNKINAAFQQALDSPDTSSKLVDVGQTILGGSSEHATTLLRADAAQWEKLIKERHIQFGR